MELGQQELQATIWESGDGRRLVGGGLLLVVGVAMGGAARPGQARMRQSRRTPPGATFTVHIYNYARLAPEVLSSAERETDDIFGSASVGVTWVDCPTDPGHEEAYPACQTGLVPANVVMKILPKRMVAQSSWPRLRMGFAVADCLPDLLGCWAAISYPRVEDLALKSDVSPALVLGKAMAHELGHLLLGPEHSDTGIMRASLDDGDFGPSRLTGLVFLVAQRERLGATLTAARATISTAR